MIKMFLEIFIIVGVMTAWTLLTVFIVLWLGE